MYRTENIDVSNECEHNFNVKWWIHFNNFSSDQYKFKWFFMRIFIRFISYLHQFGVEYFMLIKRNKFFEFFKFICFFITFSKKFSKLSYDAICFSFFLIYVFSKANDVSIELKSEEYENSRIKMTSIVSHISINFSFQWIFALFNISIERKFFNETDVQKKKFWFLTKSLKMTTMMLSWCIFQAM